MSFEIDIPGNMTASLAGMGIDAAASGAGAGYRVAPDRPNYIDPLVYAKAGAMYPEAFPRQGNYVLKAPEGASIMDWFKPYVVPTNYVEPQSVQVERAWSNALSRNAAVAASTPWYMNWKYVLPLGAAVVLGMFLLLPKKGARRGTRRGGATVRRVRRAKFVRRSAARRRARR